MRQLRSGAVAVLVAGVLSPVGARAASPLTPTIYQFQSTNPCAPGTGQTECDGFAPLGGLTLVGTTLYGTTSGGGVAQSGTVFSIDLTNPAKPQYNQVYAFTGTDGAAPQAGLTLVPGATSAGDMLYGTTYLGGAHNLGSLFSYRPGDKTITVLYSFAGGLDGAMPAGQVTYHNGYLYGTTTIGGSMGCFDRDGCGTVFRFNLKQPLKSDQVLHAFSGGQFDGSTPTGSVTFYQDSLYSTTSAGGGTGCFAALGCGTLFKVSLSPTRYTAVYAFTGGANDGASPMSGLTVLGSLLYGATAEGGNNGCGLLGCGTLFAYDPKSIGAGAVTTIFNNFGGESGNAPANDLIAQVGSGAAKFTSHREFTGLAIYGGLGIGYPGAGTTGQPMASGTANCGTPNVPGPAGTVYHFVLDPKEQAPPTVYFSFNGSPTNAPSYGAQPVGNLVPYLGMLYGETFAGGICQSGTVFMIVDPSASATANAGAAP